MSSGSMGFGDTYTEPIEDGPTSGQSRGNLYEFWNYLIDRHLDTSMGKESPEKPLDRQLMGHTTRNRKNLERTW